MPSPDVPGITLPPTDLEVKYRGTMHGIQGHHNSCYLDATLYSMFAFSSVFDTLLHREKKDTDLPEYDDVQRVLRESIVNPLRTYVIKNQIKYHANIRPPHNSIVFSKNLLCQKGNVRVVIIYFNRQKNLHFLQAYARIHVFMSRSCHHLF